VLLGLSKHCYNQAMLDLAKKKINKIGGGKLLLGFILLAIIALNFKPGFYILGNDNYSPELDPKLSLSRYLTSPGWRSYRALGVASDADQADVYRAFSYFLLSKFLPRWFLSQAYIFLAFFISSWATASFCLELVRGKFKKKEKQILFLFSGLANLTTLLTVWMFFSPLIAFMSAFAFLPLVLWRLLVFVRKYNFKSGLLLLGSIFIFSTASIVPTTFLVSLGVIIFFLLFFFFLEKKKLSRKKLLWRLFLSFWLVIAFQLPWLLSFGVYVKTNTGALQESYINRILTPNLVEHEARVGTGRNVLRYYAAWIEEVSDSGSYVYPFRDWYQNRPLSQVLGYFSIALAFLGAGYLFINHLAGYYLIILFAFCGWFLLKGINPPLGFIFRFFQNNFPLFKQVFRWQSSKLWVFLSTSLPFLAGLGAIFIYRLKKLSSFSKITILGAIMVGQLVFVFPFFFGKMIQPENYVKIPAEYFALADFLKENNPSSRIYLAPEANTLYFRQHDWGFWGSSFLNYLLPNPIVEKAMTTGSMESEDAQKVIQQSYYSKDSLIFASALFRYQTPLVLSDQSATRIKNGYEYDWVTHRQMTEKNQYLEKIWEQGKLSLYRLKMDLFLGESLASQVLPGHDWRQLNSLLSFSGSFIPYYATQDEPGLIYPLALSFANLSFEENKVSFSYPYSEEKADYQFTISNEQIRSSPIKVTKGIENRSVTFSPSFPELQVNDYPIVHGDFKEVKINSPLNVGFVSLNNYLLDLRNKKEAVGGEIDYGQLFNPEIAKVKIWSDQPFLVFDLDILPDNRPNFIPEEDSVVEMSLKIKAEKEVQANLCIWSELRLKCLYPNISKILGKGNQEIKLTLPEIVFSGEKITIFLESRSPKEANSFSLEQGTVWFYQESERVIFANKEISGSLTSRLTLAPGDVLTVEVPKIHGSNQFHFQPKDGFLPEFTLTDCEQGEGVVKQRKEGTVIYTQNCYGGIFGKLLRFNPEMGLGALIYQGENVSGVPLDVGIKSDKGGYYFLRNRLFPEQKTIRREYAFLPQETRSYFLDIFSFGTGPNPSYSQIDDLSFQFIPKSWLEWVLVPTDAQKRFVEPINNRFIQAVEPEDKLYAFGQAISPSWQVKTDSFAKKVRINGWEQGWIFSEPGEVKVVFSPDKLAYLGYIIFGMSFIFLIWKLPKTKRIKKKQV